MSRDGSHSRPASAAAQPPDASDVVRVAQSGDMTIPADVLARAGIFPGQNVVIEATADGVRIATDALRKVHVETTSHCNLDCPMCVRHGWEEPLGHMPPARFERLLQGLPADDAGRITLAFSGFGEPLVNPDSIAMMWRTSAQGHRVELITNGLLVDESVARTLVDVGVAKVTVSVDGCDEAAYARMRGVPPSGALAAVQHLLQARLHTLRPVAVGVAAVATRSTVKTMPALLEWATDLRLDFVSIGNLVPHTEEMARETLWERAGWASVFRASSWRPRFIAGRFDIDETTRPLASMLAAGGLTYPSPSVDEGGWRNRCRFAHEGMCAVSWDGRVAPCLSLLHSHTEYVNAQQRRVHEHVVGRIDEQPLATIWETASFREFRQRVRVFDFPPCFHCGGCPVTETNDEDCYTNPAPVCGECLWAQGIVLCP